MFQAETTKHRQNDKKTAENGVRLNQKDKTTSIIKIIAYIFNKLIN